MTIPTLLLFFGWGLISGRVTDPGGRPIARAEIWSGYGPFASAAPPLARSGVDGAFTLKAEPADGELVVCHDGFLGRRVAWKGRTAPPLAVVLHPVGRIRGRVLAPDGSPLPGARVSFSIPEGETADFVPLAEPCSSLADEETDALGRFTLSPPVLTWYEIEAHAEGYPPASLERPLRTQEGVSIEGIEIQMAVGATIVGRVVTDAGEPAAGARVFTWRKGIRASIDAATLAGPDGSYRLAGVAPVRQGLGAVMDGEGTGTEVGRVERKIDVAPGENHVDLTLVRPRTHTVRGRVLGPDGEPTPGARISVRDEQFAYPDGFAEEDGGFSLLLTDGSYILAAEKKPELTSRATSVAVAGVDVDGLEIRLLHGCAVAGRVRGLRPRLGQGILVIPPAGSGRTLTELVNIIDAEGRYRIDDLAPGEWTLEVEDGLGHRATGKVILGGPGEPCGERELDLVMPPTEDGPP